MSAEEVSEEPKEVLPQVGPSIEVKPNQPEQESMRSVVLTGYGGYNKLQVQKYAKPKPMQGQVVVKVHACGLNFAELMQRLGVYSILNVKPPYVPGFECAGTVEELGNGVTGIEVGARVTCVGEYGSWTEYACVTADYCYVIPEAMSFEEAAAIPITYLTAYFMLFHYANLGKRKSILIHMAAGGVGTAATQLCKSVEGVTVFGTSSASKHEVILDNGVTHAIDYRTTDYVQVIRKISPEGVDIVLDPLSGADTKKGYELLKPLGMLVSFGGANFISETKSLLHMTKTWFQGVNFSPHKIMSDNRSVCGFNIINLMRNSGECKKLFTDAMNDIFKLYNDGIIKPVIDTTWAFEDIGKAMHRMHERKNIGKVILSPMKDPEPPPELEEKKLDAKENKAEGGKTKTEEGAAGEESKLAEEGTKPEALKEEGKKDEVAAES